MLHQAELAARRYSGQGRLWQHPYAVPQPRAASAMASVWFTAYPPSQITGPGESVLESLGDAELWRVFREIGIDGMHTGPMKRAGGIRGREYTPTVDGNFDRISSEIDPAFGTEDEYQTMVRHARDNGAVLIGDVIPGHSGKGADFRLAERGYGDYPGLYHMVEIRPTDWSLLPAVPAGKDSINLGPDGGGRAQGARLHRRAAPAHHLLRAGRQGDRLVGHRRRRRRRRQEPALGVPPLLQGRAAHLQLARPHLRGAAAGARGTRSTRSSRSASACCASTRTASSASRSGRATAAPGPRAIRSRSPPTSSSPAWCASSEASPSRSSTSRSRTSRRCPRAAPDLSYDFVDPPRLPARPRHRRRWVPAPHARPAAGLPDRPGGPHPRAPEPRRAHARAGALLDAAQGRHVHLPRTRR